MPKYLRGATKGLQHFVCNTTGLVNEISESMLSVSPIHSISQLLRALNPKLYRAGGIGGKYEDNDREWNVSLFGTAKRII